jgi:hypothetical protein
MSGLFDAGERRRRRRGRGVLTPENGGAGSFPTSGSSGAEAGGTA